MAEGQELSSQRAVLPLAAARRCSALHLAEAHRQRQVSVIWEMRVKEGQIKSNQPEKL
jgi:hypothetical protein